MSNTSPDTDQHLLNTNRDTQTQVHCSIFKFDTGWVETNSDVDMAALDLSGLIYRDSTAIFLNSNSNEISLTFAKK